MRSIIPIALLACGLMLCGCPPKNDASAVPPSGAAPAAQPAAQPAAPAPAQSSAPKPAESAAPAKTEVENFWKTVGTGTVVEYTTTTDMTKPMKSTTKMTMTQTLTAKDDKGYTLKMQNTMNGTALPASDAKLEWAVPAGNGSSAAKPQDLGNEKIKTAAGEFDCKHWKTDSEANGMKTTSESWTYQGLVIKSVSKSDGAAMSSTSTMELSKLDKK